MENHSTGPRSNEGKAISSRNATRHGLCAASTLILPHENLADYKALEATWFRSYEPRDKAEEHLLHQLVTADWFLLRAIATYAEVEARILTENPDPLNWDPAHHLTLARFLRYKTTHTNTVAKHRKAIEDYRRNRASETHKQERVEIAKTRLQIHQQKHKPEPTWDETIDLMRRQAIALGLHPSSKPPNTER